MRNSNFKTSLWVLTTMALTMALLACGRRVESVAPTTNEDFPIDKLFTHEDCTMYRFQDGGWNRYFLICKDRAQVEWQEGCGKNCNRPVSIPSVVKK